MRARGLFPPCPQLPRIRRPRAVGFAQHDPALEASGIHAISSTGHLLIGNIGSPLRNVQRRHQSGAILAVTIIYWRRLLLPPAGVSRKRAYVGKLLLGRVITGGLGLTAKAGLPAA
jgi:hypothetical protein